MKEKKKFIIPKNTIQPVNRRIFVVDTIADEVIRESGLILPRSITSQRGEDSINIKIERYFVVDVALDCPLMVVIGKEKRKLKRGDEVYIFYPETAIRYEKVLVYDHDAKEEYYTFDPSEIAAVKPGTGEFIN